MPEPHEVSHGQVNGASSQTAAPKSKKKKKSRRRQGAPETLPISQVCCDVAARPFDMAWSPSNTQELLTASEDCVALWSVERGAKLPQKRLQFELTSPSLRGRLSASSARKRSRRITAGMGHSSEQVAPSCMRCAWHPEGRQFLTGSDDGLVAVWSAADGSCVGGFSAGESTDEKESEVYGLVVLSREGLLGVGCLDSVQQWDLPTCRQTARTRFQSHRSGITFGGVDRNPAGLAYVFSLAARGRVLAATLSDGTCRLLDAETCKEHIVLDEHVRRGTAAFACALSDVSPLLATTANDGTVLLWDLRSTGRGPVAEVSGHEEAVHGVAFAPAGTLGMATDAGELVVTGSSDGTIRVTGTQTMGEGGEPLSLGVALGGPVLCTAISRERGCERIGVGIGSGRDFQDNALCVFASDAKPPVPPTSARGGEVGGRATERGLRRTSRWRLLREGEAAPEVTAAASKGQGAADAQGETAAAAAGPPPPAAATNAHSPPPARRRHQRPQPPLDESPLVAWLESRGLGELAPLLTSHGIDRLSDLDLLTRDDLKEMGLAIGPRNRFLAALAASKDEGGADGRAPQPLPARPPGTPTTGTQAPPPSAAAAAAASAHVAPEGARQLAAAVVACAAAEPEMPEPEEETEDALTEALELGLCLQCVE